MVYWLKAYIAPTEDLSVYYQYSFGVAHNYLLLQFQRSNILF